MPSDDSLNSKPSIDRLEQIVGDIARSYPEQAEALDAEAAGDRERGNALSLVAKLDTELQTALRKVMIDDQKSVDQLFSENGTLFQFGPKIRIAYAFGILDKFIYDDLILISRIRNDFAHKAEAKNFKWDRIRSTVNNLKIAEVYKKKYKLDYFELVFNGAKRAFPDFDATLTTEGKFIGSVHLLSLSIEMSARYAAEYLATSNQTHSGESADDGIILSFNTWRVAMNGLNTSIRHFRDYTARWKRR